MIEESMDAAASTDIVVVQRLPNSSEDVAAPGRLQEHGTVDVGAAQEAIAAAQPRGIAVESTTVAGEQPRSHVVIARGPHDRPDEGIVEGDAMIVASHAREDEAPAVSDIPGAIA